jgi:plastocyanin
VRAAALAVMALAALPAPAVAADPVMVHIEFQAFNPGQVDALPGETVEWMNMSDRRHTVTADDGAFDSGDLFGGSVFTRPYDLAGTFAYHCTVHAGMVGEIDVRRVTLGPLPVAPVPAGDRVAFDGRTADPAEPVRIERDDGTGYVTVGHATPAADGTWAAKVAVQRSGDYRAATAAGVSGVRHLLVSDRRVEIRRTRRGVSVRVVPPLPYARVVLQARRRERFGWWPEQRTKLDYVSQASFRVTRPARVRVVLVDHDGWTGLAFSSVVRVGRR